MSFLSSLDICASGLTAQKTRIDVLTQNMINANTTRTAEGGPYRRQMVVFEEVDSFEKTLNRVQNGSSAGGGVKVAEIIEDDRPLKPVYDPSHPDADVQGYVFYPNVDKTKEMADMMAATRAYEANITTINAVKLMATKALEIGR